MGRVRVLVVNAAVARLGRIAPMALLIAAAYDVVLVVAGFVAPVYQSSVYTSASPSGAVSHGSNTLVGENGWGAVLVLLLPALLTIIVGSALWLQSRGGAVVAFAWTITMLLALLNLLAMLSIGVFLLPVTAALIVACATCRSRRGRQHATARPAVAN
jgi:hypothetical protein